MTTVALAIAAISLAGVVFLAFGYASLLALVRELQDKLEGAALDGAPRRLDRFAGDRRSFVLVIEPSCVSCKDRVAELVDYARRDPSAARLSLTVLQAADGPPPKELPADVDITFVNDVGLTGQLAVGIVPLGLVFEADGTEVGRSVLADRTAFDRMITWASGSDDHATAQLVGRG